MSATATANHAWHTVVDHLGKVLVNQKVVYVFTKVSNVGKTGDKNKSRSASCGQWRANSARLPVKKISCIGGEVIGYKRTFTFRCEEETLGQWTMYEYELAGSILEGLNNYDEYVLCRIKRDNTKSSKGGKLVSRDNSRCLGVQSYKDSVEAAVQSLGNKRISVSEEGNDRANNKKMRTDQDSSQQILDCTNYTALLMQGQEVDSLRCITSGGVHNPSYSLRCITSCGVDNPSLMKDMSQDRASCGSDIHCPTTSNYEETDITCSSDVAAATIGSDGGVAANDIASSTIDSQPHTGEQLVGFPPLASVYDNDWTIMDAEHTTSRHQTTMTDEVINSASCSTSVVDAAIGDVGYFPSNNVDLEDYPENLCFDTNEMLNLIGNTPIDDGEQVGFQNTSEIELGDSAVDGAPSGTDNVSTVSNQTQHIPIGDGTSCKETDQPHAMNDPKANIATVDVALGVGDEDYVKYGPNLVLGDVHCPTTFNYEETDLASSSYIVAAATGSDGGVAAKDVASSMIDSQPQSGEQVVAVAIGVEDYIKFDPNLVGDDICNWWDSNPSSFVGVDPLFIFWRTKSMSSSHLFPH